MSIDDASSCYSINIIEMVKIDFSLVKVGDLCPIPDCAGTMEFGNVG